MNILNAYKKALKIGETVPRECHRIVLIIEIIGRSLEVIECDRIAKNDWKVYWPPEIPEKGVILTDNYKLVCKSGYNPP